MPKVSGLSAAKVRCTVELEGWFNKEMEVATEQEAFARLLALPPDSPYWKNRWMFTKPVFLNESMQGNDPARFGRWLRLQPKALTNHIYAAAKPSELKAQLYVEAAHEPL